MKKLLALSVALSFLVAGCGQEQANNTENKSSSLEQQEGIIVDIKEKQDGRSQMLVVPNISEEDISNKKEEELIIIAQEKDGAYYGYETGKYKELEVGTHVIVYWNGQQLDSDPPQRGVEKVDAVVNEENNEKDVRKVVWEQLSVKQKEWIDGTWKDGKVSKVILDEYTIIDIDEKSYEGKEVYLIDFPTKNKGIPNNVIIYADVNTFEYIGNGLLD